MKNEWRRLMKKKIVEKGKVVVRIEIKVGRKIVRERKISIEIDGIDERKRKIDRIWNIIELKGM